MKRILVVGEHSYIGTAFGQYIKEKRPEWIVDAASARMGAWKDIDFGQYDCVLHMAGKAHADTGRVSKEEKREYYEVNYRLAGKIAQAAKAAGVKQFIYPSSIIIYGESAPFGRMKRITADTKPAPSNFYGDSKRKADSAIRKMNGADFKTAVLRLPMVYGKGSRGNYPLLAEIAGKTPIFPDIKNARSMIYIENLCEFLLEIVEYEDGGVFYPQNAEYTETARMVKAIAEASGKKICFTSALNPAVWMFSRFPGKIGAMANKAFGNCIYEKSLSRYRDNRYQIYNLEESVLRIGKQ